MWWLRRLICAVCLIEYWWVGADWRRHRSWFIIGGRMTEGGLHRIKIIRTWTGYQRRKYMKRLTLTNSFIEGDIINSKTSDGSAAFKDDHRFVRPVSTNLNLAVIPFGTQIFQLADSQRPNLCAPTTETNNVTLEIKTSRRQSTCFRRRNGIGD